jgi:pimeloyl-ACP methyl ester carboxylesterase
MAYAEFGQRDGRPLVFCHGFPSSRLAGALLDGEARALGVRVIAPDRPGQGLSDYKRRRRIAHWPTDLAALADAIGLRRFAVLGVSAGGPYAAACAALLAERVSAVGIASGAPPRSARTGTSARLPFASRVGRHLPTLQRIFLRRAAKKIASDAAGFLDKATSRLPASDRAVFQDPELRRIFADDLREAFRQGGRGPAADARAAHKGWGFRLEQIGVPVWLWHGQEDRNVPPALGRYLAERIPGSRAMFYRSEGHVSTFVNHVGEMLRTLMGRVEGGG